LGWWGNPDASGHIEAILSLLCFVMGLQNAIVTKISRAEIRTTHVTGLVTDIGIELGKMLYWNRVSDDPTLEPVCADRDKLRLLSSLLAMFFCGGLAGAFGFKYIGYIVTVPLALALLTLAIIPVFDDLQAVRAAPVTLQLLTPALCVRAAGAAFLRRPAATRPLADTGWRHVQRR
jgi:uncharacterized membrane protein YoaK (UPF0700 family)